MNFGTELTFFPKKTLGYSYEESGEAAKELSKRLNRGKETLTGLNVSREYYQIGGSASYCVEVRFRFRYFPSAYDYFHGGGNLFPNVFEKANDMGLVGRLVEKKKGEILFHPTGGGHLHVETGSILATDRRSTSKLGMLETAMINFFTWNPHLYYLFQEPFDNNNCHPLDPKCIKEILKDTDKNKVLDFTSQAYLFTEQIKQEFYERYQLFLPRYLGYGKASYPTYEFRLFSAQNNPKELHADVDFLYHFIEASRKMNSLYLSRDSFESKIKFFRGFLNRLKGEKFARKQLQDFFKKIECPWSDVFEEKFQRNYLARINYGKTL